MSAASTSTCTISKPAFPAITEPNLGYSSPPPARDRFAALTTARHGLWAGYAYELSDRRPFALISWRKGQRHAAVLARFGRSWQQYSVATAVHVAGITPRGAIVAAVQASPKGARFAGYAWAHGRLHRLAAPRAWVSVYPQSVTDAGAVIGSAVAVVGGHRRFLLVRWPTWGQAPRVLMTMPQDARDVIYVDGAGDVGFNRPDGRAAVRLASGAVRLLADPDSHQIILSNAAGHALYGETTAGVYRYDLATIPANGELNGTFLTTGYGFDNWVTSASPRGDVVIGLHRQLLRTAAGADHHLPKAESTAPAPAQGFASDGTFAFTSGRDGLVRFVRCS